MSPNSILPRDPVSQDFSEFGFLAGDDPSRRLRSLFVSHPGVRPFFVHLHPPAHQAEIFPHAPLHGVEQPQIVKRGLSAGNCVALGSTRRIRKYDSVVDVAAKFLRQLFANGNFDSLLRADVGERFAQRGTAGKRQLRALRRCYGTIKWNQRRRCGGKYVRTLVSRPGLEPGTPFPNGIWQRVFAPADPLTPSEGWLLPPESPMERPLYWLSVLQARV